MILDACSRNLGLRRRLRSSGIIWMEGLSSWKVRRPVGTRISRTLEKFEGDALMV